MGLQICRWRRSIRRYRLSVRADRKEGLMTRYGVIDTNVLVSAMLKWDSVPGLVLKHVFGGNLIPVFNGEIMDEYREVLIRKKFHFPEEAVYTVLESLQEQGISINAGKLDIELPDAKDVGNGKKEKGFGISGNWEYQTFSKRTVCGHSTGNVRNLGRK